jgi:polyribonucleotide nucleotidyltransferase
MLKLTPKIITRRIPNAFIVLNRTWWKSNSRITKATGTTIVINEDPTTEEGVIEILGTDPAGIEAVLAKIKSITFKPQMNEHMM